MTGLGQTPSQTVGPYLAIGLTWDDGPYVVEPGTPGIVTGPYTVPWKEICPYVVSS